MSGEIRSTAGSSRMISQKGFKHYVTTAIGQSMLWGSAHTMDEARRFIHIRFNEEIWKKVLDTGYKVFVVYAIGDSVRETSTNTFHPHIDHARWEVNGIKEDGIYDREDGEVKPDDILRIEIRKRIRSRYDVD